jgi:hypothetical protein
MNGSRWSREVREKRVRLYANHLALTVRRRGAGLTLYERYGDKKKIGTFRSWSTVERAIEQYGEAEFLLPADRVKKR